MQKWDGVILMGGLGSILNEGVGGVVTLVMKRVLV